MRPIYHFSVGIKVKKSKPESEPSSQAADDLKAFEIYQKRASEKFPSVSQIAHVAAILANGNPSLANHPADVADEAIKLWDACASMRSVKIFEIAKILRNADNAYSEWRKKNIKQHEEIQIPTPSKYPVTFDEFLRLTVGGRQKAHRLKIYRDYAKDMVWLGHVFGLQYKNNTAVMTLGEAEKLAAPASLDEVENYIKGTRGLIEHEGLYLRRARAFLEWRAKQPAERARKAANKRWNKPV